MVVVTMDVAYDVIACCHRLSLPTSARLSRASASLVTPTSSVEGHRLVRDVASTGSWLRLFRPLSIRGRPTPTIA
jgi:hypothetical protein